MEYLTNERDFPAPRGGEVVASGIKNAKMEIVVFIKTPKRRNSDSVVTCDYYISIYFLS